MVGAGLGSRRYTRRVHRWGRFVYAHRRVVLADLGGRVPPLRRRDRNRREPQNANSFDFESGRGFSLISSQLPKGGVTFTAILSDSGLSAGDGRFQREVSQALAPLAADRRVAGIRTPYTASASTAAQMVSSDAHRVLAVVPLTIDFTAARTQFGELRAEIEPPPRMTVAVTGDPALAYAFDSLLAADLQKAEIGSSVVALALLLIVFGTAVGALVCRPWGCSRSPPVWELRCASRTPPTCRRTPSTS